MYGLPDTDSEPEPRQQVEAVEDTSAHESAGVVSLIVETWEWVREGERHE